MTKRMLVKIPWLSLWLAIGACWSMGSSASPPGLFGLGAGMADVDSPSDAGVGAAANVLGDSAQQAPGESSDDPMKTFRAPLLREGSTLVEAQARLRRTGPQQQWSVIIERDDSAANSHLDVAPIDGQAAPKHELIVLPCTRLTEMQRILESAAARSSEADVLFEVSGRVYVFRDRNYFLPTHAVVVATSAQAPTTARERTGAAAAIPASTSQAVTQPATSADASAATTPPTTTATATAASSDDDSAESIARALEQAAGPLARSSANVTSASRASDASTRSAANEASVARGITGTVLQENTSVVNRRGRITRDRSGGWLLVFDADASGLADPPLKLLPCMLLESIEDYARRMGNNSPVIITGQVFLYEGQNHLLPTVYRIPRERSRLTP